MAEPSFGERLARESERWVAEGLVTPEQAAALRDRHRPDDAGRDAPRGRAAFALAVIGALAVGFGVIGLLAANWEELSHVLRLALLTVAIAAAYAGGYQLRERGDRQPRLGEALYLLGVLLFGASLFLVGQMYHVEAHDPLALLLWAIAAFAVAVIVRSRPIAAAALLIFTGWIAFEAGTALDDSGDDPAALAVLSVFYGGALYAFGTVALRFRAAWLQETDLASLARRLGLGLFAAGIFVFTFTGAADELDGAAADLGAGLQAGFLLLAALALLGAVGLALAERRSGRWEAAVLAAAVVVLLVAVYAGGSGALYALLFNLLLAAVALGAIYAGYLADEPWLVNVGVLLVAVDLIARYFDVFWSALPRSAGLIGAGLLILALAWLLERQRQRLLRRMDA